MFKSLYDYHSVRSCQCINIVSPPGQQIYSGSKLAFSVETKVHTQTDLKAHCIYQHMHMYTLRLTRAAVLKLSAFLTLLGLTRSSLRLQEQIGEKTQCSGHSGVNNPPHQEEKHLFVQEIHKPHQVPNHLFFSLREETSEPEIKPND